MASEQGYSNQKKKGKAQFKTIHNVGSDSYGTISANKSLFDLTLVSLDIDSVTDILGNDGQVKYWNLEIVGHNCFAGAVIRIVNNDLINFEFEVIEVPDTNHVYVLPISPVKPDGYMCRPMAWVTSRSDAQGNPQVSLSPAPVKFVLDGVTTDVSEDTVTPANSIPLPVKLLDSDLNSLKDSVTIGDVNGDKVITVTSNTNTLRSLAVADDDGNFYLNEINNKTIENGFVDYDNAWTTPLLANETFTGTAFNITNYAAVNVCVISDVPSATNGVKLEVSMDGTNWDHSHATTYAGGSGAGYIFNAEFRFARVVYTNGATPQTTFRLLTIFKTIPVKQSLYTIDQAVNGNMFVELGKNVIIGKTTGGGGGFVDVKVNPSGALTVEASLAAGTNNIGDVDVLSLPSIPAGTNNIGDVDVATLPVSFGAGVTDATTQRVVIANDQTVAVSATSLPLPSGASTLGEQQTQSGYLGALTETAPATDTASSGLNGRLQRIAQRLTSLIDLFPTSIGTKTSAASLSVVLASDQATINTQPQASSGTITQVQKSVGLTAVRATVSGSAPSATRKKLMLKPSKNNTGAIYLGSSSVSISNGLEIIGPDRLEFLLDGSDYYLISDTAGQTVEIVEVI